MNSPVPGEPPGSVAEQAASVTTLAELAALLRQLRRREARDRNGTELTYRELGAKTGWSTAVIGEYLTGGVLPPTDRFDTLVQLLGAVAAEQRGLAGARDRVAETRRRRAGGAAGGAARQAAAAVAAPVPAPWPVPRELPAPVSGFTGRTGQLARLDALLAADAPPAMVISAVSGMAGVGKTSLAVHWAHRVADRFPGGQLYLDLRGYDPDAPVAPIDALAALLHSLGVAPAAVPATLDERAARYRSLMAGRRMLVLLDNAYATEQVRMLLPGSPSCVVLVTSRDDLAGLVASHGARRLELDLLTPEEAVSLLRWSIGERVDAEPAAAAALAERCGRLPLALRVAAEGAAVRTSDSLAELLGPLRDELHRLDPLDTTGEERTAVRAVFSWSLRQLPEPAAHAFRLLGLHPGIDIDGYGVAALIGADLAEARRVLVLLGRAHLLQRSGTDRYARHDLLRAYAGEQAAARLTQEARRQALTRLFDYYLHITAAAVTGQLPHYQSQAPPRRPPPPVAAPPVAEPSQGLAWLDAERANLVAVCGYAARHGWPEHSIALSVWLGPYLDKGYHQEALAVHTSAAGAAGAARQPGQQPRTHDASVFTQLGITHWRLRRHDSALGHLQAALTGHQASGNREGVSRTLAAMGMVNDSLGRYAEALECNVLGLANAREAGHPVDQIRHLTNLGYGYLRLERYQEAAEHYQQAGLMAEEIGTRSIQAIVDSGLGRAYLGLGRYQEALTHLHESFAFHHDFGGPPEREVLDTLGAVLGRLRRFPEAFDHLDQALAICVEIGDRSSQAQVLNTLGETLAASGDYRSAGERHREALRIAGEIGDHLQHARALDGLGDAEHGAGELAAALDHWRQAHTGYAGLGLPAAHRVHDKITAAGTPTGA
jgi:tetratricopeptide (TPR) repeat protein